MPSAPALSAPSAGAPSMRYSTLRTTSAGFSMPFSWTRLSSWQNSHDQTNAAAMVDGRKGHGELNYVYMLFLSCLMVRQLHFREFPAQASGRSWVIFGSQHAFLGRGFHFHLNQCGGRYRSCTKNAICPSFPLPPVFVILG